MVFKMETEYKSRTQKKKEDQALQRLGEQLVVLRPGQLDAMGLAEELVTAIEFARRIKSHGARRRQIKHIGALLRQLDPQRMETVLTCVRSVLGDKS
jgi:ribosome-associated protein